MSQVHPIVRHLIVCEDVQVDSDNPRRVTIVGVTGTLDTFGIVPFPMVYPELCLFFQMTECRGPGDFWIEVLQADTNRKMFRSPARTLTFQGDPLEVCMAALRVRECRFPLPGLYWVELCYNSEVLAQEPLLVR